MSAHLTDDQLVDRLYGISDAGADHLESCPDCQLRWSRIQQRRDALVAPAPIANSKLRQQRRQILNRLSTPTPAIRMMWAPATAAVMLMAGFVFSTPKANAPVQPPVTALKTIDAGWFEDTYSAMRVLEPRAASPIRGLFEAVPE